MIFADLGMVSPEYSVRSDRVLFELHSSGLIGDMLCVYRRSVPAISLGRYENADASVNIGAANDDNVNIVRRISGGSSIYSDTGQLTYSVIVKKGSVPRSREESFGYICGGLLNALASLGIDAEFKPVNDILVNGRKISGSAQYRSSVSVIQHGTLITDTPRESIERYLVRKKERTYDGTTSIKEVIGHVPYDILVSSVREGFSKVFGEMRHAELSAFETEAVREAMRNAQQCHASLRTEGSTHSAEERNSI